jgi:hypothetical protein
MNKIGIHILSLYKNKFFIFESSDDDKYSVINKLIKESDWLKEYPFKSIIQDNLTSYDVNLWTLKYMYQFGISNVRGGKYNTFILSDDTIKELKYLINNFLTICSLCGKYNFHIRYYYINGYLIRDSDNDGTEYELFFKFQCNICGRYH